MRDPLEPLRAAETTHMFFDSTTGYFVDRILTIPAADLERNTLPGHTALVGLFDPLSQRVNLTKRNSSLEAARVAHPQKVADAQAAFDAQVAADRSAHDASMQQQNSDRAAAIATAQANNLPQPRPFVPTDFVAPTFIAPEWNEANELNAATLDSVEDYQPPQPSADFEWNANKKRWQLTAAAMGKRSADAQTRAEIQRLEAQAQRLMRKAFLGDQSARDQLKAIDGQIAQLESTLTG